MIKAQRGVLQFTVLALLSTTLLACGGDDDIKVAALFPTSSASGGSNQASGGSNQAPTISGSPPTTILEGNSYTFTPIASDADGNTLTFSVTNLPAWARFDPATGRISGTPAASHVGTHANIAISVHDGATTTHLRRFSIGVVGTATGSATLDWTPPTHNTDGTPLKNLAGYRVHWGTSPGNYTNSAVIKNPGLSRYVVEQLTPATWYFALTAINSSGAESSFSNVASKVVQ